MRSDSPPAGAEMSEEVRQFVAQRSIDFLRAVFAQARIKRDKFLAKIGAPGGGTQAGIPFHAEQWGELARAERLQHFLRAHPQFSIRAGGTRKGDFKIAPRRSADL